MGDAKLKLVCNRSDPRIILCFEHLFRTSQIQVTYRQRDLVLLCVTMPFRRGTHIYNLLTFILGSLVCVCVCVVSTQFRGQDSQSVALDVKLLQLSQLPNVFR